MRVFLPNLHFDDCMAGRAVPRNSVVEQVVGALTPLMGLLAASHDAVIVADEYQPTGLPECIRHTDWITVSELSAFSSTAAVLVPWGWDDHARRITLQLGSPRSVPSADAVRQINQRSFLRQFDVVDPATECLPFGAEFGRLCTDEQSVAEGLDQLASAGIDNWIAKSEWTAAGRNRLLGRGASLNPEQHSWTRKQLKSCGAVYLEPQVSVIRECSIHLDVPTAASRHVERCGLVGVVELVTDLTGRYIGSIVTDTWDQLWQPAVDHAYRIAAAAANVGYFGPLGIDCMLVELINGSRVLRMSHDINGRYTMGRLALSLMSKLRPGQAGYWSHSARSNPAEVSQSVQNLPAGSPIDIVDSLSTSPKLVGGRPPAVQTRFVVTSTLSDARMLAEWTRKQHQEKI